MNAGGFGLPFFCIQTGRLANKSLHFCCDFEHDCGCEVNYDGLFLMRDSGA